jgi:low temperature requirement protein LtrA
VRGDLNDVGSFFALAYAAGRLLLVGMLLLRGREQPGGVSAGDRLLIGGFLVGAAIWIASAWADSATLRLLLWGLALAIDFGAVLYSERRTTRDLPHQGHFPERVGLLFIVFLGAVVTELVRGAAEQRLKLADQWPAALAILTIMALWRLYFDEAHTLPALLAKRSGKAGNLLAWSYVHLPLNMALSVLSVGLGLGIAEEGKAADREERLLVSTSLALIFVCLFALRALSLRALHRQAGPELQPTPAGKPGTRPPNYSLSVLARLGGAAALLALIPAPLSTTVYETCAAAITLLVAFLSWRDPLRAELAEIEEELSEEAEQQGAQKQGAEQQGAANGRTGNTGDLDDAKGTGRIGQGGH